MSGLNVADGTTVVVRGPDDLETALRALRKRRDKTGIPTSEKRHAYFVSPAERKRLKRRAAIRRAQKRALARARRRRDDDDPMFPSPKFQPPERRPMPEGAAEGAPADPGLARVIRWWSDRQYGFVELLDRRQALVVAPALRDGLTTLVIGTWVRVTELVTTDRGVKATAVFPWAA
jgi:ribosomal protein S21